ncbi:hypothetical protein FAI40_04855 [Acetobacteraceae bacterium]|nr:hypothetical protein FAI40_04855 [Acetobacteraceae bacterium]
MISKAMAEMGKDSSENLFIPPLDIALEGMSQKFTLLRKKLKSGTPIYFANPKTGLATKEYPDGHKELGVVCPPPEKALAQGELVVYL